MDGSYGQPARNDQYSMSSQTQPTNTFQVNVKRNKTRKWVEAKTHSYDGDDWGADEFDDDDDEDEEEEEEEEEKVNPQPQHVPPTPQPQPQTQTQPQPQLEPQSQSQSQPQQQQRIYQYQLPSERIQLGADFPTNRSTPSPTSGLNDLPSLRTHTRQSPSLRGLSPMTSDPAARGTTEQAARKSPTSSTTSSLRKSYIAGPSHQPSLVNVQNAAEQAGFHTSTEDGSKLTDEERRSERRLSSAVDRRDSWERSDDSDHSLHPSRPQSQEFRAGLQMEEPMALDRKTSSSPRPLGHKPSYSLPMGGGQPTSEHRRSPTLVLQTDGSSSFQVPVVDADEDEPAFAPGGASLTANTDDSEALSPRGLVSVAPLRTPSPCEPRSLTPILLSTNPNFTPTEHSRASESPADLELRLFHRGDTSSSTEGSSPVKENDRLSYEILKTLRPRGATMGGISLTDDPRQSTPASEHGSAHERSYSLGVDGQWDKNAAEHNSRTSPSPPKLALAETIGMESGGRPGPPSNILRRRFSWEAHDDGDEDGEQGGNHGAELHPEPPAAMSGTMGPQQQAMATPTTPPAIGNTSRSEAAGASYPAQPAAVPQGFEASSPMVAQPAASLPSPVAGEQFGKGEGSTVHQTLETTVLPPLSSEATASHSPIALLSPTAQSVASRLMSFKEILALGSPKERIAKFNETRRLIYLQESGLDSWLAAFTNRQPEQGSGASASQGSTGQTVQGEGLGLPPISQTTSQSPFQQQFFNASGSNLSSNPASMSRTRLGGLSIPAQMSGSAFSHSSAQIGTKSKEFMHSAGKMGKGLLSKGKSKLRGSGDKGELLFQAGPSNPRPGERRSPWRLSFSGLDPKTRDAINLLDTQTKQEIAAPQSMSPPDMPVQSPRWPFDAASRTGTGVLEAAPPGASENPNASDLRWRSPVAKTHAHAHDPPAANQSRANGSGPGTLDAAELSKSIFGGVNVVSPRPIGDQYRAAETLSSAEKAAPNPAVIPKTDIPKRVSSFIGLPPITFGSELSFLSSGDNTIGLLDLDARDTKNENGLLTVSPLTPGLAAGVKGPENDQPAAPCSPQPSKDSVRAQPSPARSPTGPRRLKDSRLLEPLHLLSRKRSGANLNQQALAASDTKVNEIKSPARQSPSAPSTSKAIPPRQRSDLPPLSSQRYPTLFAARHKPDNRANAPQSAQANPGRTESVAGEPPSDWQQEEQSRGRSSSNVFKDIGTRIIRVTSKERQRSGSRTRPTTANAASEETPETESTAGESDNQENKKKWRTFPGLGTVRASMDQGRPAFPAIGAVRASMDQGRPAGPGLRPAPVRASMDQGRPAGPGFGAVRASMDQSRPAFPGLGVGRVSMDQSSSSRPHFSGFSAVRGRSPFKVGATTRSSSVGPGEGEKRAGSAGQHHPIPSPNPLTRSTTAGPVPTANYRVTNGSTTGLNTSGVANKEAKEAKEPKTKGSGIAGFFGRSSKQGRNNQSISIADPAEGASGPKQRPRSITMSSLVPPAQPDSRPEAPKSPLQKAAANFLIHRTTSKAKKSRTAAAQAQQSREPFLLPKPSFGPPIDLPEYKTQASDGLSTALGLVAYGQRTAFAQSQPVLLMDDESGRETYSTLGKGPQSEAGKRADQIETDIENPLGQQPPGDPNQAPTMEAGGMLQPCEESGKGAAEDSLQKPLLLTPIRSFASDRSLEDREEISVSPMTAEKKKGPDEGRSSSPIALDSTTGAAAAPDAAAVSRLPRLPQTFSIFPPKREPSTFRMMRRATSSLPRHSVEDLQRAAQATSTSGSSLRSRISLGSLDQARGMVSRKRTMRASKQDAHPDPAESQDPTDDTPASNSVWSWQQTYRVSITAMHHSSHTGGLEEDHTDQHLETKTPGARWRELRSRMTEIRQLQNRPAKANASTQAANYFLETLRRSRRQAEPPPSLSPSPPSGLSPLPQSPLPPSSSHTTNDDATIQQGFQAAIQGVSHYTDGGLFEKRSPDVEDGPALNATDNAVGGKVGLGDDSMPVHRGSWRVRSEETMRVEFDHPRQPASLSDECLVQQAPHADQRLSRGEQRVSRSSDLLGGSVAEGQVMGWLREERDEKAAKSRRRFGWRGNLIESKVTWPDDGHHGSRWAHARQSIEDGAQWLGKRHSGGDYAMTSRRPGRDDMQSAATAALVGQSERVFRTGGGGGVSQLNRRHPHGLVPAASISSLQSLSLDLLQRWDEQMVAGVVDPAHGDEEARPGGKGAAGHRSARVQAEAGRERAARWAWGQGTAHREEEEEEEVKMSATSYPGQVWDPWRLDDGTDLQEW